MTQLKVSWNLLEAASPSLARYDATRFLSTAVKAVIAVVLLPAFVAVVTIGGVGIVAGKIVRLITR